MANMISQAIGIQDPTVFWAVIATGGILMFLLTCTIRKTIEIVVTSIIGSLLFIHGINAFVGGLQTGEEMREPN